MPKTYSPVLALPRPGSGGDLIAEGDDIIRELTDRLDQVVGPPTGPAGGDLGGNYPNPQVVTINGKAVSAVVFNTDSRLTDSRTPSGAAGGELAGAYPNPTVAKVNGRNASSVVFTDDTRLADQRAPSDGSVTTVKLADGAATSRKVKPTYGQVVGAGSVALAINTASDIGVSVDVVAAVPSLVEVDATFHFVVTNNGTATNQSATLRGYLFAAGAAVTGPIARYICNPGVGTFTHAASVAVSYRILVPAGTTNLKLNAARDNVVVGTAATVNAVADYSSLAYTMWAA